MPDQIPARGFLIALEGGEGSGKTSQAEMLTKKLNQMGKTSMMVREPGGTPLGNRLREYLKSNSPISLKAETLLFVAARAETMQSVIIPALNAGVTVISDRHQASTVAYQGYGRRGDHNLINQLNLYATDGITPDLTILLDLLPETGLSRVGKPQLKLSLDDSGTSRDVRIDDPTQTRFEDQPLAFHRRVRNGYLQLARSQPNWQVVDASNTPEQVQHQIWQAVNNTLYPNR